MDTTQIAVAASRRPEEGVVGRGSLVSHRDSFSADQRGAISFEVLIVFTFLMFGLVLPLTDLAIAGFKFISAYQALRDMAQRTQFSPPDDVTTSAGITAWTNLLPTTVDGYSVSDLSFIYKFLIGSNAALFSAHADNLYNDNYVIVRSFPMPGRSFLVSFQITI